jgi:[ribosomal protein S5]-alanine N-acetyltransferase
MRLLTDRLILRTFETGDVDGWMAMFGDPEVIRFLDPGSQQRPRTAELFEAQMVMRHEMERELGFAMLAVELQQTGEFIGQCGLRPLNRLDPNAGSEIDLAYHFARAHWGQGYATEAVVATLGHGLTAVGLPCVMAVADPQNVGSWRVMEKAGMRYAGTTCLYGCNDLKRYVAERNQWESR